MEQIINNVAQVISPKLSSNKTNDTHVSKGDYCQVENRLVLKAEFFPLNDIPDLFYFLGDSACCIFNSTKLLLVNKITI